jgi:DnaJ homolog subfamily C member 28
VSEEAVAKRNEGPARRPWRPSERVNEIIEEAIQKGLFDHLPGQGKPLDLSDDDNPFVPEDMRLAYRMLRQHGYALPWIEDRKEIDAKRAEIERRSAEHATRLRRAADEIRRLPAYLQHARWAALRKQHGAFRERQAELIDTVNRRIDGYNLAVPVLSLQTRRVSRTAVLARLDAALAEAVE